MLALLSIASSYNPSRLVDYHVVVEGAPTVTLKNYECSRYDVNVYYTITAYIGATIVWGMWITSKAFGALTLAHSLWSNSSKTWEIRLISYAIYFMSAALAIVIIFSPYVQKPWYIHELFSAWVISSATCVAMSIKWLPKLFLIYNEKLLQQSSVDEASNKRESSNAIKSGVIAIGAKLSPRRKTNVAASANGSSAAHSKKAGSVGAHSAQPDSEMLSNMPLRGSLYYFGMRSNSSSTNSSHTPNPTPPTVDTGFFTYVRKMWE
jgi:hypothetical protein